VSEEDKLPDWESIESSIAVAVHFFDVTISLTKEEFKSKFNKPLPDRNMKEVSVIIFEKGTYVNININNEYISRCAITLFGTTFFDIIPISEYNNPIQ